MVKMIDAFHVTALFLYPKKHLEKRGVLIFSVGIEGIEGIVVSLLSSEIGLLSK